MIKNEKIRCIIGAIINLIIFMIAIFCLILFIKYIIEGNKDIRFRYYTNISNLLVGFIALPNAIFLIISAVKGKIVIPKILSIIKFSALSMIALTFITVLFIIAPIAGFYDMYKDVKFLTHLIVPVFAVASYFLFEEKTIFDWKITLFSMIPTIIYSIVYVLNVIAFKSWPDLYQINNQGLWFLFVLLENAICFGIIQGIYFIKKAIAKRCEEKEIVVN